MKQVFIPVRSKAKALLLGNAKGIHAPLAVRTRGGWIVYSAYAPVAPAPFSTKPL